MTTTKEEFKVLKAEYLKETKKEDNKNLLICADFKEWLLSRGIIDNIDEVIVFR